jgi:hypothetical protein
MCFFSPFSNDDHPKENLVKFSHKLDMQVKAYENNLI